MFRTSENYLKVVTMRRISFSFSKVKNSNILLSPKNDKDCFIDTSEALQLSHKYHCGLEQ